MTPCKRFQELRSKGLCCQCLYPGADQKSGRNKEGKCQRDYVCKNRAHESYPNKKHVLVCQEHAISEENKELLEAYKARCIIQRSQIPAFAKNIKISFHANVACPAIVAHKMNVPSIRLPAERISSNHYISKDSEAILSNRNFDNPIENAAIYTLQTIQVDGYRFTIFNDTGCSDLVTRFKAIEKLGKRAVQEYKGPISIGGVGDLKIDSHHGIYQIRLPLYNGRDAILSGVCLDQITTSFPMCPMHGRVADDIESMFIDSGGKPGGLPTLPPSVGGETDFMFGAKYLRYHPTPVFQLPSGLTIYKSMFINADGGRGVVGGPHEVFNKIDKYYADHQMTFFSNQYQLYKMGMQTNPDIGLLHVKCSKDYSKSLLYNIDDSESGISHVLTARNEKIFKDIEEAGSVITYRCSNCRNCKTCKENGGIEFISIKEEIDQEIINQYVAVDLKNRITYARLPLLHKAEEKLSHNKQKALKVYNLQIRKLEKNPRDKADVIAFENKLQSLAYVDYVKNLSKKQQLMLLGSVNQYFIPWRAVWNGNSISTPCRLVFDASQPTSTGLSLNDVVAKGKKQYEQTC